MRRARTAFAVLLLAGSAFLAAESASAWLSHVPTKDRAVSDPLPQTPDNVAAGQELYQRNCAVCHGKNGEGRVRKPSLRTADVHSETDGELFWLLRNGSLGHGMPSWSQLPEPQRWQLIQYLRTLPQDPQE